MTLPTSRAEAQALGANKYDTGQPCRNGHTGPRYVLSGVCAECLRVSQRRATAAYNASLDPLRKERAAFARDVVVARERIPVGRYEAVAVIAEGLLSVRFPALVGHVAMRAAPHAHEERGGTARYDFLLHRDDRAALHLVCEDTLRQLGIDVVSLYRDGAP